MSTIGQKQPFDPLKDLRHDLSETLSTYQNVRFSKKTVLDALESKINTLYHEYNALYELGCLPENSTEALHKLALEIQIALSKGSFFKGSKERVLTSLDALIEKTIYSSSTPLTPTLWAGSLAKRGREEEAFQLIDSLEDPNERAEAFIEMVNNGAHLSIIHKMNSLPLEDIICFSKALEKHKDSIILMDILSSLPASLTESHGLDERFTLAFSIEDPSLQGRALGNLVRSGGAALSQLLSKAEALPEKQCNNLIEKVQSAFLIEIINSSSDEEILNISDYFSNLENAKKVTPYIKKGIELFFSWFSRKIPAEKTEEPSSSPTNRFRDIRKTFARITGFHEAFSSKSERASPSTITSSSSSSRSPTPKTSSYTTSAEDSISPQELLNAKAGSNLFPILHEMIGKQTITNLESQDDSKIEGAEQFSISISMAGTKKVPAPALTRLLEAIEAPKWVIPKLANKISVDFPNTLKMTRTFIPIAIEFDPSTPISFKVSSKIANAALSTFQIPSSLSVRQIITNESGEIEVVFDTIKDGNWMDRNMMVNLGEPEQVAFPFWKEIWESAEKV